jgi:hypothetical protein
VDPSGVVPLLVEVGEGGAVARRLVVQQTIGKAVRTVEERCRRLAPRLVPVGLHLGEVAAADASSRESHVFGARLEFAASILELSGAAHHPPGLDQQALDTMTIVDFELVTVGVIFERGDKSFDDGEAGPPGDVPPRDRVARSKETTLRPVDQR